MNLSNFLCAHTLEQKGQFLDPGRNTVLRLRSTLFLLAVPAPMSWSTRYSVSACAGASQSRASRRTCTGSASGASACRSATRRAPIVAERNRALSCPCCWDHYNLVRHEIFDASSILTAAVPDLEKQESVPPGVLMSLTFIRLFKA